MEDLIELLKTNPVEALTSGKLDESFIGIEVTLPNSVITCQEWVIADVNHDGTSGTVDLFSKTTLTSAMRSFCASGCNIYKDSDLDNYLESAVYNGFSMKVKNALNYMNVSSNGETIQRHVVAPSLAEIDNDNLGNMEGTIYPIFDTTNNLYIKDICKRPDGKYVYYWTRSADTMHNRVWGYSNVDDCCDNFTYAVARIRFAKKEDNIMEERRPYTKEEDDYIMDNWTLKTHKEIAETLNRSVKSVISRHKKLVIRANKEDKPQQQEGSSVIVTVAKVLTGANGLPVCHVLSIDNYNVLDYLKQEYDKRRLPMVGVISKFVHNVIHSENAIAFCDEIADALIYSEETYEGAIKHCLDCVFTENELDLLCKKVAEKTKNETFSSDNIGYHDMLEALKSDPVTALTSGKLDERFIGVEITLPNSAIDCQEWIIADVNHGGTGTVDLFSKTTLTNDTMKFNTNSQYYKGSTLDNYLESTVYNGFTTEVKNALNLMNVVSDGEIIQRHVVVPSLREVGNSNTSYVIQEGTIYPIFSPACNPNPKSIFKAPDGNVAYYWTRSRNTSSSDYVWRVTSDGNANYIYYGNNIYVVARLRFAAK